MRVGVLNDGSKSVLLIGCRYIRVYCSVDAAYEFAVWSNAVCKLLNETSTQDGDDRELF